MIVRELFAKLGLNVDMASFKIGEAALGGLGKTAGLIAGSIAAAGAGLAALVYSTAEAGTEILRSSAIIGLSTDKYQKFTYATAAVGMSAEDTEKTLSRFSDTLIRAARDGGDAALVLNKLGVHWRGIGSNGKDVVTVLQEIADKYEKMPNGIQKTAATTQLFGERHTQLLNLLNKGGKGIADLMQEYEDLGAVMDEKTVKASEELVRDTQRLTTIFVGFKRQATGPLIEDFDRLEKRFIKWLHDNRELIKQRLEKVIGAIRIASSLLLKVLISTAKVLGWIIDHWKGIAVVLGALSLTLLNVIGPALLQLAVYFTKAGLAASWAGIKAAVSWAIANAEVFAIIAVFAILILLLEDVYTWLSGGDSLIGELGPKWTKFLDDLLKPNDDDPWWLETIKRFFRILFDLQGELPKLWDDWVKIFGMMGDAIVGLGKSIWDWFKGLFNSFVQWITDMTNALVSKIKAPIDWLSTKVQGLDKFLGGIFNGKKSADISADVQTTADVLNNPVGQFGAGASPLASADAQASTAPPASIAAPNFEANIQIQGSTDPKETASQVRTALEDWHKTKMREALAGVSR